MGGNSYLGNQVGEGINRARMQQNPMPPGQMGPPNPLSMIPEFEFDPEKGLNVTLSPDHLQQIISMIMRPQAQAGQPGRQPIIQPQASPQQQQMGGLPDPNMYRRPM